MSYINSSELFAGLLPLSDRLLNEVNELVSAGDTSSFHFLDMKSVTQIIICWIVKYNVPYTHEDKENNKTAVVIDSYKASVTNYIDFLRSRELTYFK